MEMPKADRIYEIDFAKQDILVIRLYMLVRGKSESRKRSGSEDIL